MKRLERRLGLGAVVSISISSMLGSGIFVLPGIAVTVTGPSIWLAYLLAALAVLPAALSKSELATAMPTSGGTYVYLERSFGPLIGTVAGLGLWLSLLLKSAFALMGFGAYLKVLAPQVELVPTSVSILIFIIILNILGVGKVSSLLMVVVGICIALLAIICSSAVPHFDPQFLSPLFPSGFEGLMAGTALVFVSYAGVTKVAAIAEEISSPEENLPRGIMISLLIVTLVYTLTTFVLVGNIPISELAGNLKPIHLLAEKVGGRTLEVITAVVAIVTMSSMANSGILAASRFPFAMSRDKLLPSLIGDLHQRFLTPVNAIIISGLVVGIVVIKLDAAKIAKFASAFILMIYMAENFAVVILRETRVQWYKPSYESVMYPFTQIFGIICTGALLVGMGFHLISLAVFTIGIPGILLYIFYSRNRTDRKGVIGIRGKRQDLVDEKVEPITYTGLEFMDFNKDANVVVTLFGKERSPEMLIEMGIALAEQGNLEVAHITEVPEQTDLGDIMEEPVELKSLRRRVVAMAVEKKESIAFDPVVSHDISKTIYHISQRFHCQWLLIEWRGRTAGAFTFHNPMGWLKGHLSCHLGIFKDKGVRYIRKIFVYLKGDHNDDTVISTSDHLAEVYKADITLTKYLPLTSSKEDKEKAEKELLEKSKKCTSRTTTSIIKGTSEIQTVVDMTIKYDLLIFGGSPHTFWSNIKGTSDDYWMAKSACSVISVQSPPESDLS